MTDPKPPAPADADWRGDFAAAEQRQLEHWAAATPSQRLAWLEEALRFAHRVGALPKRGE